jgi:hypothetical protein
LASSEPNSPTLASPGYTITPEKQGMDLKSLLMVIMEDFKREMKENTGNELEAFKEKTKNPSECYRKRLPNRWWNWTKQFRTKNGSRNNEENPKGDNSGERNPRKEISNRLQEMEERISGTEESIENMGITIKENAKYKKILTQNIQEIQDKMKRLNVGIIGVDENEDFQIKGPANIFNKIIEENFPNLKKEMPMNIQEAYRTPNRMDQKKNCSWHIIIRTTNALNKDRILKTVREKAQVTYKGRPIRITPDFSPETIKARKSWTDVIQTLREEKCQSRLLYPAKLSIAIAGETKVFHDKTKFTQYISMNPALQKG